MLSSTLKEPWTLRPTNLERKLGRLLRSPEGHDDPPPDDPSLVNEPPKDEPPKDEPPKDEPPKDEPPVVEPLKIEDFKAPEGFEIQPEMATEFLEILNGQMEPKDRAQALLDLHAKTISAALEKDSEAWDTLQTQWRDEAKNDPEIGGNKLQPTLTSIGKLLDEFGTKEVRTAFDMTGAGNNVHVIKFLNNIAAKLTEGGFTPGTGPRGDLTEEEKAQRLFPSMKG